MGFLKFCCSCCMCLSVWAIIQLSLMGYFYYIESPILIEDAHAHKYTDFKDFIKKTRKNYRQIAYNCWVVAGAYAVTLFISIVCLISVNQSEKTEAAKKLHDEELICGQILLQPSASGLTETPSKPKVPEVKKGKPKQTAPKAKKARVAEPTPPPAQPVAPPLQSVISSPTDSIPVRQRQKDPDVKFL